MSEKLTADIVRSAIAGLVEGGASAVSPSLVREALGLASGDPRVQGIMGDMMQRGELERTPVQPSTATTRKPGRRAAANPSSTPGSGGPSARPSRDSPSRTSPW
jgi:hypothetical protein